MIPKCKFCGCIPEYPGQESRRCDDKKNSYGFCNWPFREEIQPIHTCDICGKRYMSHIKNDKRKCNHLSEMEVFDFYMNPDNAFKSPYKVFNLDGTFIIESNDYDKRYRD